MLFRYNPLMHKTILIFLLLTSYIYSNMNVIVSILPQQTFVKAIGGKKVNISLMVQPGSSPHSYEPKPSQMKAVANAELYFTIGVEFENIWLSKFSNLNTNMKVVDLTKGVKKLHLSHKCTAHSHTHNHTHEDESSDPHIWTSPENVKIIAQNIYNALAIGDKANAKYYKTNLDTFLASIDKADTQIKDILSSLEGSRTFMVFHPSWGYFANEYNLEQIAVEIEGKNPKPRELVGLIKEAKKKKVSAIFTQPEFSDTSAKIIAKELKIPVIKASPMAANWSDNLIGISKAIAGNQ